jgi:hypothetical protein
MTEAKHTPGPWIVHRGSRRQNDRDYMAVIDSIPDRDGQVVANCICHVAGTNPDKIANADLIAAAPDLLEACELMIDAMVAYEFDVDDCPTPKHRSLMTLARNAIAKAKEATK